MVEQQLSSEIAIIITVLSFFWVLTTIDEGKKKTLDKHWNKQL